MTSWIGGGFRKRNDSFSPISVMPLPISRYRSGASEPALAATVRCAASPIRVRRHARLGRAADRSDIEQIFAIQADIASAIAAALGTEMSADEQGRISARSAAGYACYLRALNYCRDRRFAESIRELNAAIGLDPEFAEAYALRAMIYAFAQVTSGGRVQLLADGRSKDEDFVALALAEAARALELDERAGLAWAARAVTHAFHFRMGAARTAFRQALEASPNNSDILVHYAAFEAHFGSVDETLALVERAARWTLQGP